MRAVVRCLNSPCTTQPHSPPKLVRVALILLHIVDKTRSINSAYPSLSHACTTVLFLVDLFGAGWTCAPDPSIEGTWTSHRIPVSAIDIVATIHHYRHERRSKTTQTYSTDSTIHYVVMDIVVRTSAPSRLYRAIDEHHRGQRLTLWICITSLHVLAQKG